MLLYFKITSRKLDYEFHFNNSNIDLSANFDLHLPVVIVNEYEIQSYVCGAVA